MALASPGFFGKVPARGDFIARRLDPALMRPWDAWLALLTTAVRDAAGTAWPEAWLTAPVWHFALGAAAVPAFDAAAVPAPGAAGAPAPGAAGVLVASMDRVGRLFPFTIIGPAAGVPDQGWSDAVESLILDALDDAFDPDVLDAALLRLGAPQDVTPLNPGVSLWRCRGSDRVAPTCRCVTALPDPATAAAMVLGDGAGPASAQAYGDEW